MKQIRTCIVAALAYVTYAVLRALPLDMASGFGGRVARTLGPHVNVHRVAQRNLAKAMPELSSQEQRDILNKMWDNLGRVFAEYPHLNSPALHRRIRVVSGLEHLYAVQQQSDSVLFVSGHLGNWEVAPLTAALHGAPLHLLFRSANNKIIDRMIETIRKHYSLGLYAKGTQSARAVIRAMQKGEPVGMLIDQKTNDAITAQFFGQDAMTSTAVAQFVTKFHARILPAYCVRTSGANFDVIIEAPLTFDLTHHQSQDVLMITQAMNDLLERWIRQDPGQWFWVHKRWPHSKMKTPPSAGEV